MTASLTSSQRHRLDAVFARALAFLKDSLGAERALVLFDRGQGLEIVAWAGIEPGTPLRSAPVSVSLLEKTFADGAPVLTNDAQADPKIKSVWSLRVSEIRSLLCVPFWGPKGEVVGLLYADHRATRGAFTRAQLDSTNLHAREVEKGVRQALAEPAPTFASPAPPSSPASGRLQPPAGRLQPPSGRLSAPPERPQPTAAASPLRPRAGSVCFFFRGMATMLEAGIPISRALTILGEGGDDPRMSSICRALARKVARGQSLSEATAAYPRAFGIFQRRMLRVGERSGRLTEMLAGCASFAENRQEHVKKLLAALVYPLFVMTLCTLGLLVGAPYVLEGQFRMIRESGVQPPLLSRIVMAGVDLTHTPLPYLAGLAAAALLAWASRREGFQRACLRRALQAPGLGPALRSLTVARFARALAIQMEAGLSLLDALPESLQGTGNPVLATTASQARKDLESGRELSLVLRATGCFPPTFVEMVRSGEECGQIGPFLHWLADFYELEVESALNVLEESLQPLAMLVMGTIVGLLMLAAMVPMASLLETL